MLLAMIGSMQTEPTDLLGAYSLEGECGTKFGFDKKLIYDFMVENTELLDTFTF